MARTMTLAVAQLGPVARGQPRAQVVERLAELLLEAARFGAGFVVFPELALTTFFPRWYLEDEAEIESFFEAQMPNAATAPLFALAADLDIGFNLGYAELVCEGEVKRRFNTSILVDGSGTIVGKYRKIHLPGHERHEPERPWQHLEKRYFEPGDLGFPVFDVGGVRMGMYICNDRRWPETWRVMGLQGAELITGGYNTPVHNPPVPQHDHLMVFHHLLSMQAGAYQNGAWTAAAGKVGCEEGCMLLGSSCIVAPTGEIVARSTSLEDEVIVAVADFERCREVREEIFDFRRHRQPQHYGLIAEPHR